MWPGPVPENPGNYHIVELPPHTQENTKRGRRSISLLRNYLRVRGEYKSSLKSSAPSQELPPYAENTGHRWWSRHGSRNYLRIRGEYLHDFNGAFADVELPPHARRIQGFLFTVDVVAGTTSACAENTTSRAGILLMVGNYLRMRGEYPTHATRQVPQSELPPHARRIPSTAGPFSTAIGTTSACAENTIVSIQAHIFKGNYLRMRGEYPEQGC